MPTNVELSMTNKSNQKNRLSECTTVCVCKGHAKVKDRSICLGMAYEWGVIRFGLVGDVPLAAQDPYPYPCSGLFFSKQKVPMFKFQDFSEKLIMYPFIEICELRKLLKSVPILVPRDFVMKNGTHMFRDFFKKLLHPLTCQVIRKLSLLSVSLTLLSSFFMISVIC